jgi:hypothetical protein
MATPSLHVSVRSSRPASAGDTRKLDPQSSSRSLALPAFLEGEDGYAEEGCKAMF